MLKQVPCQVKQLSNTLPTGAACLTWCLPICCSLMKMITGAASAPMTSDLSFNHTGIVNQAAPQTTLHIPQAMVALSGLAHRNACNAIQLLCWSHVMKRTSCVCVCLCVRVSVCIYMCVHALLYKYTNSCDMYACFRSSSYA